MRFENLAAGTYTIKFQPTWTSSDKKDYTIGVYAAEKVAVKDSNGKTNEAASNVIPTPTPAPTPAPLPGPTPAPTPAPTPTPTPTPIEPTPEPVPVPVVPSESLIVDLKNAIAKAS